LGRNGDWRSGGTGNWWRRDGAAPGRNVVLAAGEHVRLAKFVSSIHVRNWARGTAAHYTFGSGTMPNPEHSGCIILWGTNPVERSSAKRASVALAA
jgi:hypothetical protein